MPSVIKEALRMLRSQGIRIPHEFTRRIKRKAGFTPRRQDIKLFRERIADLTDGDRLVVGVKKDRLVFTSFEIYQKQLKTALNARKYIHDKKALKEEENVNA